MSGKRSLGYSFGVSLVLHLGIVAAISLWMASTVSLDLSARNIIELTSEKVPAPPEANPPREKKVPPPQVKPPKLIEKTPIEGASPASQVPSVPPLDEEMEKLLAQLPAPLQVDQGTPFAFIAPDSPSPSSPDRNEQVGWGPGEIKAFGQPIAGDGSPRRAGAVVTQGSEAGAGMLSAGGDFAVIPGGGSQGGGGGTAKRGLGMGPEGLSTLTPGGGGVSLSQEPDSQGGAFSASRPLRIRQVLPSYPHNARMAGVEGVTRLKVEVLPDGRVGRILLEASSGDADLDRTAQVAVSQWRFAPARQGDRRIKCWVKIPIRFRLAGG